MRSKEIMSIVAPALLAAGCKIVPENSKPKKKAKCPLFEQETIAKAEAKRERKRQKLVKDWNATNTAREGN